MQNGTFSAAAAARYLGFVTSNPILDAIDAGEITAERGPGGRNGKPGNFRIRRSELDRFAVARGLELPDSATPAPAPEKDVEAPEAELSNVVRLVPQATPIGFVTIPIEHYAELVSARAELRLLREHPELAAPRKASAK